MASFCFVVSRYRFPACIDVVYDYDIDTFLRTEILVLHLQKKYMDIIDVFRSLEALRAVFQMGYIPTKEEFYELTPEQYERYYESQPNDPRGEKVFMLLPHDAQKYNEIAVEDVFVCTEHELHYFDNIEKMLDKYCKNSPTKLETIEDKLYYAARFVPDIFTDDTQFARHKLIYLNNDKEKKKSNKTKKKGKKK
jgi:hypothetical protein